MSQAADLELLKEIPGYKVILKSVIKTQIQFLMEQLSDQTGEESIVITASVKEGTLSHLGSDMGKGFFDEGRDEIKSQFLGYCLNKSQTKSRAPPSESDHEVQLAPKRKKAKTNHKAGSETSDLELRQNPKKSQFLSSRYTGIASVDTGGLVNQVEDSGESQFLRTPGSVDQEGGQSDSYYSQGAYVTSGTSSQYTGDEPDQSAYTGMEGINPQIMVKSEPGGEDDAVAYLDGYGLTGSTDMVYQSDDPGDQSMNQSSNEFCNSMMLEAPGIRRRSQISVAQKKEIILYKMDHPKATQDEIATHFACEWGKQLGRSTISEILRGKTKWINAEEDTALRRRSGLHGNLEEALFMWYSDTVSKDDHDVINDQILVEKARFFGEQLNIGDFQYSKGWLHKFKKRHKILTK